MQPSHVATAARDSRVFFALSDATRRELLDRLRTHDGQRLSELSTQFDVSRQAIGKHVEILEEVGLVVVRRSNRETRLFLNRVPIRDLHARWIERFTRLHPRLDCG